MHLAAAKGMLTDKSVLLTSSVISPALKTAIAKLGLRHVSVDAISSSARLNVYESLTGKRGLPTIDLENTATVFAVGADFLGDWGGQNLMAAHKEKSQVKACYVTYKEAGLSISGSNSDVRIKARVSEYEAILAHIYIRLSRN